MGWEKEHWRLDRRRLTRIAVTPEQIGLCGCWHASLRLQPLFKDDGKGEDRRWTMEGVIDRLKSIRKNRCILAGNYLYDKISQPDKEQEKILDLLGSDLCCQ